MYKERILLKENYNTNTSNHIARESISNTDMQPFNSNEYSKRIDNNLELQKNELIPSKKRCEILSHTLNDKKNIATRKDILELKLNSIIQTIDNTTLTSSTGKNLSAHIQIRVDEDAMIKYGGKKQIEDTELRVISFYEIVSKLINTSLHHRLLLWRYKTRRPGKYYV